MIELDRHIEILLLGNDCVIVPGLGGFMTHSVNAYYDKNENLFLPPMRTLGFNAQLTINDSLLAQSYVEAYDISFPEAIRRIESEVTELKERIATDGMYELTDIGTLSVNADGKYEFKPCEAGILTPSLYGLSSFEMKKISNTNSLPADDAHETANSKRNTAEPENSQILPMMKLERDEIDINKKEKQATKANSINEEEEKELNDDTDVDSSRDTIIINMQTVRNAVAVAAAIICFFIFTLPLGNSSISNMTESSVHNGVIYKLLSEKPNQTVKKMQNTAVEMNKKADTHNETNTAKAEEATPKTKTADAERMEDNINQDKPYCLVLASHVTKRNAKIFVDQLHGEGYDNARMVVKGKTVRVVFGEYENESKAYHELNRLHERDHFEQAWVYEIK